MVTIFLFAQVEKLYLLLNRKVYIASERLGPYFKSNDNLLSISRL